MKRTPFKRSIKPFSLKPRKLLRKKRKGTSKHKAWDAFSVHIRKRDADQEGITSCISCGKRDHWKNMDAGHFVAAGVSLKLRFDERNVHAQCGGCNRFDSRSIHGYTIAMRRIYGPDIVEELEQIRKNNVGFKIYENDYREILEKYSKEV